MDYLRHDQRPLKEKKKKENKKVKVVSKTLKSMVRLVTSWQIEQQIQKSLYEYRGDTPVSFFFAVVQCWDIHIYFVHSPCRVSTPLHRSHANSVAERQPADRFPMRPCTEGPERTRRQGSTWSGSSAPPQASGCMTILSLQNTMTATEGGGHGGQEPMQFTCSSFGQQ